MPIENAHVKNVRRELRDHYAEGISEGVELPIADAPGWIQDIFMRRTPSERGLLLGVLLEEYGRMDDATGD